jgi:hypothetical protein
MKTTNDPALMHDYEPVTMRDGNPLGVSETPKCKNCGMYWAIVLRSHNYSSYGAAWEMCPSKDPDRITVRIQTAEETIDTIREMQNAAVQVQG